MPPDTNDGMGHSLPFMGSLSVEKDAFCFFLNEFRSVALLVASWMSVIRRLRSLDDPVLCMQRRATNSSLINLLQCISVLREKRNPSGAGVGGEPILLGVYPHCRKVFIVAAGGS